MTSILQTPAYKPPLSDVVRHVCANNVRRACSGERDQALCKGRGARAERLGVTPRGESADYGPRGESADFGEQLLQEMPPSMFDCDEVPIHQS